MPVLRHKGTGALVTVSDERAGSLPGSEWVTVEKPKPATRSRKAKAEKTGDD